MAEAASENPCRLQPCAHSKAAGAPDSKEGWRLWEIKLPFTGPASPPLSCASGSGVASTAPRDDDAPGQESGGASGVDAGGASGSEWSQHRGNILDGLPFASLQGPSGTTGEAKTTSQVASPAAPPQSPGKSASGEKHNTGCGHVLLHVPTPGEMLGWLPARLLFPAAMPPLLKPTPKGPADCNAPLRWECASGAVVEALLGRLVDRVVDELVVDAVADL